MRVLHVASEVAPFCQTGGLGEVVGSLPDAVARLDHGGHVAVACPYHRIVDAKLTAQKLHAPFVGDELTVRLPAGQFTGQFRRLSRPGHVPIYFFDCPPLFDRAGIYGDRLGEFEDNPVRFAVFVLAVQQAALLLGDGEPFDIYHLHDWQTGLFPLFAKLRKDQTPILFTLHNLAFQGLYSKAFLPRLGLPWSLFSAEQCEYFDQLSLMKAGLAFSDGVSTVSPTYAREVLSPATGEGLDGFLRYQVSDRVGGIRGIVNGIDLEAWDPEHDDALARPFSSRDLAGRAACRRDLVRREFPDHGPDMGERDLVIGMVSRMTHQKGIDLICELVPRLHSLSARLIVHGSGDAVFEDRLRWLAERFREHLSVHIGFDAQRARRIYAGADLIMVPSRFEPCGLSQLFAMRYGGIPVAHRVGGLVDTIRDTDDFFRTDATSTGFLFSEMSVEGLWTAVTRAAAVRARADAWSRLQRRAMAQRWDWSNSAHSYASLYRELIDRRGAP